MAFSDFQRIVEAFDSSLSRILGSYPINVFYSEKDGGYIAEIPDLKYCSAFGETPEIALAELLKAKSAWLLAARLEGKSIPKPKYRPLIYQVPAG